VDSGNRLWVGGDYVSALTSSGVNQWVGGFVRYPTIDSTAPAAPTNLVGGQAGADVSLTWAGVGEPGVTYEIIAGDRVVFTTTSTAVTLPATGSSTNYFVRARDAAGNRSASTAALTVDGTTPPPPPPPADLVAEGGQFAYRWSTAALDAGWASAGFDDSSWSRGSGPVGYGSSLVGTNVAAGGFPTTRPLSIQGRASFTVADPSTLSGLQVTTYADDGVVVYVNGTEVGRANLGTGTITQNSYASVAARTATARTQPLTFAVPAGLLRAGTNVLAVQVNANYRSTPDMAFAVSLRTR
jgi:hypothetical protein